MTVNGGKKPGKDAEALYRKGLISLEGGQYDYAVAIFREALSIDPGFTKAGDGIRTAKALKLQKSSRFLRKIKQPLYVIQGAIYKRLKNYDMALDKYESAFAVLEPPSCALLSPLGDLYYEKGMTEYAVGAYKSLLQKDINNIHCLRKLGKIYIEQGSMAEAKKIYDHLAAAAPSDDSVLREVKDAYAILTIDRGRWEEDSSFRRKLRETEGGPGEPPASADISPGEKSRLGDRVVYLKKQTGKNPDDTGAVKELADALRELRRTDEAIPLYKKILREEPDNMDVLRSIGNIYIKSGEYEKAVKILEHINELLPRNANVLRILGGIYEKQDAGLKAVESYLKLAEIGSGDAGLHETIGKLYEQNRYFEEAITHYEKAIELDPGRAGLHERIGDLLLRDEKIAKAVARYEKAAAAAPGNIRLRKTLADLYLRGNMFAEAERTFREILRVAPDDGKTRAKLEQAEIKGKEKELEEACGRLEQLEGRPAKPSAGEEMKAAISTEKERIASLRIEILRRGVKNDPDCPAKRFELAKAFMETGDTDSAAREFQITAQDPEKEVESLHMLGLCFERKNILDIAARRLEKALEKLQAMDDKKKAVLYDLGRVYEKSGEKEKAMSRFKEIYEEDITYRDVGKKIEEA